MEDSKLPICAAAPLLRDVQSVLLWWRWRRRHAYSERLIHEVVVSSGPDGRPGERLLATSRSIYQTRMCPDDSREDFRILVGRRSTLAVVCFSPDSARAGPDQHARQAVRNLTLPGDAQSAIVAEHVAGEAAASYRIVRNLAVLTEWVFAHDGWLFAAGVLCHPDDDEHETVDRARAVLASWRWIEAPPQDSLSTTTPPVSRG